MKGLLPKENGDEEQHLLSPQRQRRKGRKQHHTMFSQNATSGLHRLATWMKWNERFNSALWIYFIVTFLLTRSGTFNTRPYEIPVLAVYVIARLAFDTWGDRAVWHLSETRLGAIWYALKHNWVLLALFALMILHRHGVSWAFWAMLGCLGLNWALGKRTPKESIVD